MKEYRISSWTQLTEEDRIMIELMFWGPYRPEWKNRKGLVENGDETIGKRLSIKTVIVSRYTELLCAEHFARIALINKFED